MSNIENNKKIEKEAQGFRLAELRKFLGRTQAEFANEINLDRPYLAQIESGRKSISYNTIMNVTYCYKNASVDWLLKGTGEMFKKDEVVETRLAFFSQKPNVILYNVDASAGGLIAAQNESGEPIEQWYIPNLVGQHIAVNVLGNSMSPTINDSDKIIAKEIFRNELRDGNIYIVVTTDSNVRVKRLRLNDQSPMLWSDNVTFVPRYERLILEEVIKIYHVVMVCKAL